ncbi:MAG: ABC transporter permease [Deltaproteobacteria bacterium]|nr:ABC transporter permease [Deltaproteobacteria bacterium]
MKGIRQWHRYYLPATLLLLLVVLSVLNEHFLTVANFRNVLYQASVLAIVSIGMTFVIIGGGFDLSVGSLLALAGSLAALVMSEVSFAVGLLGGLLTGILFGLANGLLVSKLLVSPFIATLGTLVVARGLALAITGGATVATVPEEFAYLGTGTVAGVPIAVLVTAAAFLVMLVLLRFTPFGLKVYAVGGNREAARLAGIKVDRVVTATYVISGLLAAMGGLIVAARVRSGQPTVGVFMELFAIAAVVLGGASLRGGEGGLGGTILGVLLIGFLQNGLNLLDVHSYWQQVVVGVVFIGAASLEVLRQRT